MRDGGIGSEELQVARPCYLPAYPLLATILGLEVGKARRLVDDCGFSSPCDTVERGARDADDADGTVVDTAPSCCGRKASIAAEHTASGKQPADADIHRHMSPCEMSRSTW